MDILNPQSANNNQDKKAEIQILNELRQNIFKINFDLLDLFFERKQILSLIQQAKIKLNLPTFLPEQEKSILGNALMFEKLKKLSVKEWLAFSLLWEAQASEFSSYPRWSCKVHIKKSQSTLDLEERINPLLLKLLAPAIFEQLLLSDDFLYLKNL